MRTIRPAHGSEALKATASACVVSRTSSGPWTISAFGANSRAAASLWFAFRSRLHWRTMAAGGGGGAANTSKAYD
jgi:hypothetical protein